MRNRNFTQEEFLASAEVREVRQYNNEARSELSALLAAQRATEALRAALAADLANHWAQLRARGGVA